MGDPLVDQDLGGAQDLLVLPLREDDALGGAPRLVDDAAHQLQRGGEISVSSRRW